MTTCTGHEQRNINWERARANYNVSLVNKTQEEIEEVIAFFYARRGRAIGFRFKDWMDYQGKNQVIGVGENITSITTLTIKAIHKLITTPINPKHILVEI